MIQEFVNKTIVKDITVQREQLIKKALAKYLGKEEVTKEDVVGKVEIIKQGNQEWIMYEGKTIACFDGKLTCNSETLVCKYIVKFFEANNPAIDKMVAENKMMIENERTIENERQRKLWEAVMEAIDPILNNDSISKQDEPKAIAKRLQELGFKLSMVGV